MNSAAIQVIDSELIGNLCFDASRSQRRRKNYNLHEMVDPVHRFLNAIEPEAYVRPHRHTQPQRQECFVVLRAALLWSYSIIVETLFTPSIWARTVIAAWISCPAYGIP